MILELLFIFFIKIYFLMIFISIPKGRNFFNSLFFLSNLNIKLINNIFRKIILKTNRKNIFLIIIKNKDIKKINQYKIINISFIGSDLIFKKKIKKNKLFFLKSYLYINNNFFLLTKYFNICNYYNLNINIIKFNSSLEFFLKIKNIGIIDISETNITLKKNKLFPKKFIKKIIFFIIYNNLKKNIIKYIKNVKNK
ncbi:ATP phosphoribosyltransferase [Candidatus Carsonella ruddii HC isolate Thao2000]|uniref:ATP phosphoribosyltransferase n=2 Tax=Carsonella ruddii TaxID=114186 RepID=J3TW31_CARRU|nr:ATP phosphoribosyltransferase [Candidatus Carsonella ruddii HC isolate Thao2000]